jgi:hypothetical protein
MGFLKGQEIIKKFSWEIDSTMADSSARTGVVNICSVVDGLVVKELHARVHTAVTKYAAKAVTSINTTSNVITSTAHGFNTGTVVQVSTTTTLPGGISASTDYYVINLSVNTLALAETAAKAQAGTKLDITTEGTGTHTMTPTTVVITVGDGDDTDGFIADTFADTTGLKEGAGDYLAAGAEKAYAAADTIDFKIVGQPKAGKIDFFITLVRY